MYIIYKRNGNGGANKKRLYFNIVAKNEITLKVIIIIINVLSKSKNGLTPF